MTVSGQAAVDEPARPAALCRGVTAENRKVGRNEETELNGVQQERGEMSDEGGDEIDGEEELAVPIGEREQDPGTGRHKEEHEAAHVPFRDWCAHCMMGRGRTHHHVAKQKE